MALILVNNEDLYHFRTADDIAMWLERNPTKEMVIIDDEQDGEVTDFLYDHYPIRIQ